jgi:hypothetical protein
LQRIHGTDLNFTFQTNHNLNRDVVEFRNAIVSTSGKDKRSAGFFTINSDKLETTTESIFLVMEVEDAVAGTEEVGLDVSDTTQQQLQLISNGLDARVLGIGVVLSLNN